MKRLLALTVVIGAVAAGTAGAALGPSPQWLRTSTGGYVNACLVARIESGMQPIADGSIQIPSVQVALVTRDRIWLDRGEGDVNGVVASVDAAMQLCRTIVIKEKT